MQLVKLGTIINLTKGKKPKIQSEKCKSGFMPYIDIKAFETGKIDNYTDGEKCLACNEGDILIVCDGSRSGLVGKALKGYVGSTLAKISADGLRADYLYYFLQGKYKLLNTKKKGTGTPHLNQELLKEQRIYVPSLVRQKRIVARIEELFSELDKSVETLQIIKQQLEIYRQAVLKEALSEQQFSTAKIHEVCSEIVDCPHSTPKWVDAGYLCLRTTNFKRGFLDLTVPNYVSKETFSIRNKRLIPRSGDVLYSREGSILGIACIIPEGIAPCLGQRMMLLRVSDKLNNRFLMHYLNSPMVTNHVITTKGGTGSPHINVGDIKNFDIPIPSIELQGQIVALIEKKFSVCDSIERTVDTVLSQAEAMRQSILKKAFEGGLSE